MPRVNVPFSLDVQADGDILDWLDTVAEGRRSAAIREAIRAYLSQQTVTLADVYQAVLEIKRHAVAIGPEPINESEADEDPEISDNLDKLLGL